MSLWNNFIKKIIKSTNQKNKWPTTFKNGEWGKIMQMYVIFFTFKLIELSEMLWKIISSFLANLISGVK